MLVCKINRSDSEHKANINFNIPEWREKSDISYCRTRKYRMERPLQVHGSLSPLFESSVSTIYVGFSLFLVVLWVGQSPSLRSVSQFSTSFLSSVHALFFFLPKLCAGVVCFLYQSLFGTFLGIRSSDVLLTSPVFFCSSFSFFY